MITFNPPAWLKEKQLQALENLKQLGLPLAGEESWRYSPVKSLARQSYVEVASFVSNTSELEQRARELCNGADFYLCFYNGDFLPDLSHSSLSEECLVAPLSRVLMSSGRLSESAREWLARSPNNNLKGLGWENYAHFKNGAMIHINECGSKGSRKVAIINFYGVRRGFDSLAPFAVYPKNIFVISSGAKTEIVEAHVALDDCAFKINAASDWRLEEGSEVKATQISKLANQVQHIHDTHVELLSRSNFSFLVASEGSQFTRNEVQVELVEENSHAQLNFISSADHESIIDNNSAVLHLKGETVSRQLSKSIVRDNAKIISSGRLLIVEDAQKSDAAQYNHNLLLSDTAEVDARPQLEVFADDVKAAHGATVGKLSEDEIFYLRSRGLSREQAETMLMAGFQNELSEKLESLFLEEKLKKILGEKIGL